MRTAGLQEQPGRTPVLVLGASGGQEGAVAEVMMRAGLPVRAFIRTQEKLRHAVWSLRARSAPSASSLTRDGLALAMREAARALALTTPDEVLRVLIACC